MSTRTVSGAGIHGRGGITTTSTLHLPLVSTREHCYLILCIAHRNFAQPTTLDDHSVSTCTVAQILCNSDCARLCEGKPQRIPAQVATLPQVQPMVSRGLSTYRSHLCTFPLPLLLQRYLLQLRFLRSSLLRATYPIRPPSWRLRICRLSRCRVKRSSQWDLPDYDGIVGQGLGCRSQCLSVRLVGK
jgi:hypothetical protein